MWHCSKHHCRESRICTTCLEQLASQQKIGGTHQAKCIVCRARNAYRKGCLIGEAKFWEVETECHNCHQLVSYRDMTEHFDGYCNQQQCPGECGRSFARNSEEFQNHVANECPAAILKMTEFLCELGRQKLGEIRQQKLRRQELADDEVQYRRDALLFVDLNQQSPLHNYSVGAVGIGSRPISSSNEEQQHVHVHANRVIPFVDLASGDDDDSNTNADSHEYLNPRHGLLQQQPTSVMPLPDPLLLPMPRPAVIENAEEKDDGDDDETLDGL